MATVRKVSPEEAASWVTASASGNKGKRLETRKFFDTLLMDAFNAGDPGVELTPDEGEKKLTIRNNVLSAAKRNSLEIKMLRSKNVRFAFVRPTAE